MRIVMPVICGLLFAAIADAAGDKVVIQGDNVTPTFDHGYLAAYIQSGRVAREEDRTAGGGYTVNVDIDSNGSVAEAVQHHGASTGDIWIFSPNGSPAGQIATGPYRTSHASSSQICVSRG